jgi:hypothetical protein
MKKIIIFAGTAIFALSFLVAGCDDEDKCDKCIDDYCDCLESAGEDLVKVMECATDAASCIADNDCDEGDLEDETCG